MTYDGRGDVELGIMRRVLTHFLYCTTSINCAIERAGDDATPLDNDAARCLVYQSLAVRE